MLGRDVQRCQDAYRRVDSMPLGSGALAGLPYPLDRESVARELGFSAISRNSMDAVSDRDFVAEYLAMASLAMAHLSRLAEEVVLWTTVEFGYLELDDAFATGSSIMPQKKNPDVAELVRGKTGRVYGHLIGILTVLKGLPLTYNKDLQEDKEGLFDAGDTLLGSLRLFAPMLQTARVRADRMRQAAGESFSLATDVADYLVGKGLPFREAHGVVGRLVAYCLDHGKDFGTLSLEEYRGFSPLFDESVHEMTVESAVAARNVVGGTAPNRVAEETRRARGAIAESFAWAEATAAKLPGEELFDAS
jgi:argininosuccinate lyase